MKHFIAYIRPTAALLALLLALPLAACGKTNGEVTATTTAATAVTTTATTTATTAATTPAQTEAPAPTELSLIAEGKSDYKIIRDEEASESIVQSAITLNAKIEAKTGHAMGIGTDWYSEREENPVLDAPEILVGQTNRPESAEVLASLPENSYTVTICNNKLVILGTNNSLTAMALFAFEERILGNSETCRDGYLHIGQEHCFTETYEDGFSLSDMIRSGHTVIASSAGQVAKTAIYREFNIGQGSCSDGTYVYFVLRNSNDTGALVVKHRLDDGSFVAVSDPLDLGHGNDMTYDTKNDRLVIAHGQSEGQILTLVDPQTLTLIRDIDIPKGAGAITYNEKRNIYAISQGGSTLHMLTADFAWITSYTRPDDVPYTAQGMGSDDDYIYFPMSGKSDNVLVVYDWEGRHITNITIPLKQESESMFWVNGKYYVAFNHGGEMLHEMNFEIIYQ